MSALPTRVIITSPIDSIERLVTEAVLVRRTAAALRFEVKGDARITNTQNKYACEAVAQRIVAAQLAWPVSIEDLTEVLQRSGIRRDRAKQLADSLAAESTVRREREMVNDQTAAEVITGYLNGSPYVSANIRLANAPDPTPEPEVLNNRPPRHENPIGHDGRPPSLAELDQAREAAKIGEQS